MPKFKLPKADDLDAIASMLWDEEGLVAISTTWWQRTSVMPMSLQRLWWQTRRSPAIPGLH